MRPIRAESRRKGRRRGSCAPANLGRRAQIKEMLVLRGRKSSPTRVSNEKKYRFNNGRLADEGISALSLNKESKCVAGRRFFCCCCQRRTMAIEDGSGSHKRRRVLVSKCDEASHRPISAIVSPVSEPSRRKSRRRCSEFRFDWWPEDGQRRGTKSRKIAKTVRP